MLYQARPRTTRVAPEDKVFQLTSVLADDNARQSMFGLNSPLKLPRPGAVKSGSSDETRDAWTIGYTPQLVTGVWVGNANNAPIPNGTSTYTAAPIWRSFMISALEGQPVLQFTPPGQENRPPTPDTGIAEPAKQPLGGAHEYTSAQRNEHGAPGYQHAAPPGHEHPATPAHEHAPASGDKPSSTTAHPATAPEHAGAAIDNGLRHARALAATGFGRQRSLTVPGVVRRMRQCRALKRAGSSQRGVWPTPS